MNEQRDEQLSRIYREIERPEPPPRIDDAILAASRRAVGAKPQPMRRMLTRFWDNPVALAATIVLTFTVTLMMLEQSPELFEAKKQAMPGRDSAPPLTVERPAPAQAPVDSLERRSEAKEKAREAEQPKPAAPAPAKRADEFSYQRKEEQAAKPAFVPDAPARSNSGLRIETQPQATQDQRAEPETRAESDRKLRLRSESAPAAAPAPTPAGPPASAASGEAASPAVQRFQIAPLPSASMVPPPAAAPPPERALQEAPSLSAAPASRSAPVATSPATSSDNAAIYGRIASGIANVRGSALSEETQRSPEDWIKAIRALKTEGKTADVERELTEFKRRYPNYILPNDLR